eukprot:scaffold9.g3305.t1
MASFNPRAPSVKRIMQELREIASDDNPDIVAEALEENIFEWHFAIRGAWDTEFEGGIYHGRILMPAEYPFKPPAFVMLTPSGRFETGTKICLSISSHHPESWQPSWSVRSALVALIAFMQTPGSGAVGSLDHPAHARRLMAAESRARPPAYGSAQRQELLARMHARMLEQEPRSRALYKQEARPEGEGAAAAEQGGATPTEELVAAEPAAEPTPAGAAPASAEAPAPPEAAPLLQPAPEAAAEALAQQQQEVVAGGLAQAPHQSWEDRGLTYLALLLGGLILTLLLRKVLVAHGPFRPGEDMFGLNHVTGADAEL